MKKLNFIDKIVFLLNAIVALVLLLSYILPKLEPKNFGMLSVLSLAVPLFIILNGIFALYWLLKVKKQVFLSLFVLVLGYGHVTSLYKFSGSKKTESVSDLSVMNFNVRLFNLYNWIDRPDVEAEIVEFIDNASPDVISFQEYHPHKNVNLVSYPYKYEKLSGNRVRYGQAIFSKFPILNSGSIEFPETANNAIYADIVKNEDTIRIYNVHLQSLRIDEKVEDLDKERSERLLRQASSTFKKQQSQTELFLAHKTNSPYRSIICGDFNNSAYSYVYKKIKGNYNDAFEEAGNGFGRTFNFKYFPVRIDFILVDKTFEVNGFKTFSNTLSDHFPIQAKIGLH